MRTAETVGAAALIIVEFFPRQLIGIFGAANESQAYTDFAIKAFRTYLFHCFSLLSRLVNSGFLKQINGEKAALYQSNPNQVFLQKR
jgi:hypothetical protein